MSPLRTLFVACATLLVASGAAWSAMADWAHRAPIERDASAKPGVVEFALTPVVYDRARPSRADLRVTTESGVEIPYVVARQRGSSRRVPHDARLYNKSFLPGRSSSLVADFSGRVQKNLIAVRTTGSDFRRKITVEGSDDGIRWRVARAGAYLFRVRSDGGLQGFDKSEVSLPDNDWQFLRVTVENGADDEERVEIEAVRAWHLVAREPVTVSVPIAATAVTHDDRTRTTAIELDLAFRNLPLHSLSLSFRDENFFRRIVVEGRDERQRVVSRRVENAPARETRVDEPWRMLADAVIYRYAAAGSVEESPALSLDGLSARYLRITIRNGDDAALNFGGAAITRFEDRVCVKPVEGGPAFLYFGNPRASSPSYDFSHFADKLRAEGVSPATLGAGERNPDSAGTAERQASWPERHKGVLLWAALLGVLAVLGLLVWRQAKAADTSD
jgi:hypothetical protein